MTEKQTYRISASYLHKLPENLVKPYANTSSEWQILIKVPGRGKVYQYVKVEEHLKKPFY